jgi:hypothetical protein
MLHLVIRTVDEAGRVIDSSAALAYLYFTRPFLYEVVRELVRAGGDVAEVLRILRSSFRVRFNGERVAWEAEHVQFEVLKAVLSLREDGNLQLDVILPVKISEIEGQEHTLVAVWKAIRALNELREDLGKLKDRVDQLEDELRRLRENLEVARAQREQEVGEGEG